MELYENAIILCWFEVFPMYKPSRCMLICWIQIIIFSILLRPTFYLHFTHQDPVDSDHPWFSRASSQGESKWHGVAAAYSCAHPTVLHLCIWTSVVVYLKVSTHECSNMNLKCMELLMCKPQNNDGLKNSYLSGEDKE